MPTPNEVPVKFWYKNHRGEQSLREVKLGRLYFGSTEYHPEKQWLLKGWDVKKGVRTFALKDCDFTRGE